MKLISRCIFAWLAVHVGLVPLCAQPLLIQPQNRAGTAGNPISNLRVGKMSGDGTELTLTLDFSYDGLHGTVVRIEPVISDKAHPEASRWFGAESKSVGIGRGSISIKVKFFNDEPGVPSEVTTSQVRIMMLNSSGTSVVGEVPFTKTIKWGSPNAVAKIEAPPVEIAGNAISEEKAKAAAEAQAKETERMQAEAEARLKEAADAEAKLAAEQKRVADEQAKAAEAKRIADEQAAAEAKRIADEQAKAAETKRIADEQAKAAETKRIADEQAAADAKRIADEQAKAAEGKRVADEQAKAAEAKRIADEQAAAEAKRVADEQVKAAEAKRVADEQAKAAEAKRIANEQAAAEAKRIADEQAKAAETKRVADEQAKAAEAKRIADEQAAAEAKRIADDQAKAAETKRIADEQAKAAEAKRIADEQAAAEAKRIADEQAKAAETKRIADEQARAAEAKRIADEQAAADAKRIADEQAKAAEAKRIADEQAKAAEDKRIADQQAAAEAKRIADEQAKADQEIARLKTEADKARAEAANAQAKLAEQKRLADEAAAKLAAARSAPVASGRSFALTPNLRSKITSVDVINRSLDRSEMTIGVQYAYVPADGFGKIGIDLASEADPAASGYFSSPTMDIVKGGHPTVLFPVKFSPPSGAGSSFPTDKIWVYLAGPNGEKSYISSGTMLLMWHAPGNGAAPSPAPALADSTIQLENFKQIDAFSGQVIARYNLAANSGKIHLRIYDSAKPESAGWFASEDAVIKSGPGLQPVKIAVLPTGASPDLFNADTIEITILDNNGKVLATAKSQPSMIWAKPK